MTIITERLVFAGDRFSGRVREQTAAHALQGLLRIWIRPRPFFERRRHGLQGMPVGFR
jgi:hypothetical protein